MKKKKQIKELEVRIQLLEKELNINMSKKEPEKKEVEYINPFSTYRSISAIGHYGSTTCGNCNEDLDKKKSIRKPLGDGTYQAACPSCYFDFDQKDHIHKW